MIPGFFFCLSATRCPPFFVPAQKLFDFSAGFHAGAALRRLPVSLGLTFFNPLDDHYGFSPLEAAAMAVDT